MPEAATNWFTAYLLLLHFNLLSLLLCFFVVFSFLQTEGLWQFCINLLSLLDPMFFFLFYKLKVCGNSASSKSIGTIFPTAFAHYVSVSHFGNSCNIFNFFIIIFIIISPGISDLWCYYCACFGAPQIAALYMRQWT